MSFRPRELTRAQYLSLIRVYCTRWVGANTFRLAEPKQTKNKSLYRYHYHHQYLHIDFKYCAELPKTGVYIPFQEIPSGMAAKAEAGMKAINKNLNRFKDIYACKLPQQRLKELH